MRHAKYFLWFKSYRKVSWYWRSKIRERMRDDVLWLLSIIVDAMTSEIRSIIKLKERWENREKKGSSRAEFDNSVTCCALLTVGTNNPISSRVRQPVYLSLFDDTVCAIKEETLVSLFSVLSQTDSIHLAGKSS